AKKPRISRKNGNQRISVRSQGRSSRTSVQQALIGRDFTTQKLKNPGKSAFSGVFLYPFRLIAFEAFRCF
ncbi:hypothetical protein, partial [Pseudoflavonifractor phocaeensis]|uniref:hypothetical protein n=1 Tax=Pseudoflavonifractor phocaeensis TaxID=1870988 RepID=UPI00210B941D